MSNPDTENLRTLLINWQEADPSSTNRPKLAEEILQAARAILNGGRLDKTEPALWHDYLHATGSSGYLTSLPDRDARYEWAETAGRAILSGNYRLLDMFMYRVACSPKKALFKELANQDVTSWSYKVSEQRIRSLAAGLLKISAAPRVAIVSNNSVESAFADLACLFYGITVTPLNVHFDAKTIGFIIDELDINIILTDCAEHRDKLQDTQQLTKSKYTIYALATDAEQNSEVPNIFRDVCMKLSPAESETLLCSHKRRPLTEVITVMFTSGSTGLPKGISFSEYNLISKRFARAAALPEVGNNEVMLCYLPLYHTFGRYLELLGTIYWGGTYIFAGNPSTETFFELLAKFRPTGLISVPIRWQQIFDKCQEVMETTTTSEQKLAAIQNVTGSRLKWGLSAAGYLAPTTFQFFNNNDIKLCSGFGMTEATGGITMTPPGKYREHSIGIPLPLVETKLSEEGELSIAGSYIARYLDEKKPGDDIPVIFGKENQHWLSTGDLFRILPDSHLQIIDRLKDIYKNSKGQTIAPAQVERRFDGVPGIKRTFLVGDAREFNVLLIVPDKEDPVTEGLKNEQVEYEYYHQIVSAANKDLATYERVVNFAILKRDFSLDKDELTPKGSLKRKQIEKNFADTIKLLYQSKFIELVYDQYKIKIPRWFYRDLGILEDSIVVTESGLFNKHENKKLSIKNGGTPELIQIGDFIYEVKSKTIDFGKLSRQPSLWLGNAALIEFCPCKIGWDTSFGKFTGTIRIPKFQDSEFDLVKPLQVHFQSDPQLSKINSLLISALFGNANSSEWAIEKLAGWIKKADERVAGIIRRRLVLLATHPEFKIRSLAYRVLLLDEPSLEYGKSLPAFIESGLPFLDEDSIAAIAHSDLSIRKLLDLRRRFFNYRTAMKWPVSDKIRDQFVYMLALLANYAKLHPEYYDTIRCELSCWVLHKEDEKLASIAEDYLGTVINQYEAWLEQTTPVYPLEKWDTRITFGDELNDSEIARLKAVLTQPSFLKQSIMLAFDQDNFDLLDVEPGGIWVSRITSRRKYVRYRVSINTKTGKHFDLQVILNDDEISAELMETIYWLLAISKHPYEAEVLPRLGCCRPELGARSLVYYGQLTMWEKIREYSERRRNSSSVADKAAWRKLYVRGLTAIFKGWKISGKRIIPGFISPENLVVPHQDFIDRATILTLTGWKDFISPLSLIEPIVRQFFTRTIAHYPWCRYLINIEWLFDACLEELGNKDGREFLEKLALELPKSELNYAGKAIKHHLEDYLEKLKHQLYLPLPLCNAINRYEQWANANIDATPEASEQIIKELWRLYRLDRYPEIIRYYLYYQTYFSDASAGTREAFANLIGKMYQSPEKSAMQLIELSRLQATLDDDQDRILLSKIIFPRAREAKPLEVVAIGESERKQVIVKTHITDRHNEKYYISDPKLPSEIGKLYRLFIKEGYRKTISDKDRFLIVFDSQDQIVGGLCYRFDGADIVQLDGSIVAPALAGNGLGSAMLEDFCNRMTEQGVRLIKTHFFLRKFYTKRGFKVDSRWGALVRFLKPETNSLES